eukprot:jgi/Mesvir1/7749/Mv11692-RA.1
MLELYRKSANIKDIPIPEDPNAKKEAGFMDELKKLNTNKGLGEPDKSYTHLRDMAIFKQYPRQHQVHRALSRFIKRYIKGTSNLFRTGPFTYAYIGPWEYEFQTVGGHPIVFFEGGRTPLAIDKAGTAYALLDGLVFDAKVLGTDPGRMAESYAAKRGTFPATKMRVRRL